MSGAAELDLSKREAYEPLALARRDLPSCASRPRASSSRWAKRSSGNDVTAQSLGPDSRCVAMGQIALSGVIAALSHALDIAEGQPPGHAVRSCVIGMRVAAELDLDVAEHSDLFYALLLKDAGCSANANRMAALFETDDRTAKASAKLVDWTDRRAALRWSLRTAAPGAGLRRRMAVLRGIRDAGDVTRSFIEARCDRGAEIARMLFLSEETAAAIRNLDEHWDGSGMPDGLCGEAIPLAARIACLAQTVEVFHAHAGVEAARAMAKRRRGSWFDPSLVDALLRFCGDGEFWAQLETPDVSQWEPPDFVIAADDARLDRIAEAFARVIDAKSPFTARHSSRVAEIADGIAAVLHFDTDRRCIMRRAALLHDIGKLAVSNRILDKPGKLNDEEFRAIQTHPVHTLSILERAPCFAQLAELAANHHERLDGSGYPRSLDANDLDLPMRVLAVADVYEALTADRPYRGPLPAAEALALIDRDVPQRLDADVRDALKTHLGRAPVAASRERLMLSNT
jgi:putative nucleotidyltransferase with HDIG domain